MSQAYSNPSREFEPTSLPDVEVFYKDDDEAPRDDDGESLGAGWYWWSCFPGCLPDSDACGPFETEAEALAEAQEGCDD